MSSNNRRIAQRTGPDNLSGSAPKAATIKAHNFVNDVRIKDVTDPNYIVKQKEIETKEEEEEEKKKILKSEHRPTDNNNNVSSSSSSSTNRIPSIGSSNNFDHSMLKQEQQEELANQDALLDTMHHNLEKLSLMGATIHTELTNQETMVNDTNTVMDETTIAVQELTRKTNELIRKNGGPKWCGLLTGLTIILLILIWIALN